MQVYWRHYLGGTLLKYQQFISCHITAGKASSRYGNIITLLVFHTNVTTSPKLVSGNTGSVTTNSSPLAINSFSGLSKLTLVAFSNATGFLIYSVFDDEVMLGAFRRNSPSHNCCNRELRVVSEGKDRRWVCAVQTGQVAFCS